MWSNRSNPLLTIVKDTVGRHDFLLTPCSEATFRHFYPEHPVHRGWFGNLAEALGPYGIEPDMIPCAFNLFMNVPVAPDGRLRVDLPASTPGDFIRLRAERDLVIGLTACSADASNGGSFKPIHYQTAVGPDDGRSGNRCCHRSQKSHPVLHPKGPGQPPPTDLGLI